MTSIYLVHLYIYIYDPSHQVMLLPDKKTKLQTNIKRRNLNPRWNELMEFEGIHTIT